MICKSFTFTVLFIILLPIDVIGQEVYYQPIIRPDGVHYRVYESTHFEIIFEEGVEVEAWQTALILERALAGAQELIGSKTPMRMPVILNNSSDRSNGFVHTHPFRQEIESPHIKGNRLGTRHHSWIESVAPHELVHAVHADANEELGIGRILRWFAPDAARIINLTLPSGLNEGVAVFFESQGTNKSGRLNDARFQMQFRAAIRSQRPWSLSQLMERSRYGFHANRHYIGGANFFAWMHDRDQGEFFRKMRSYRYRFMIPLTGIELRMATSRPLGELMREFHTEMASQSSFQVQQSNIIVSQSRVRHRWPQWLNEKTLIVYRRALNEPPGLYSIDIENAESELVHPIRLPEDDWFSLQDSMVTYSRYVPDRFSTLKTTADVFTYDLRTKTETRLTSGVRAHMPVKTAEWILALQNDGQRNSLIQIDDSGEISTLRARSQADLIQIAPAQDSTAVIVRHRGTQGIYLLGKDGELSPWIFLDDASILEMSWSSSGRYLLFTADSGGITNVYCFDLQQQRASQLTDVVYGALDPVLSEDHQTLVYVDYHHERYNIVSEKFLSEDAPSVTITPTDEIPDILPKLELPENFTHRPYSLHNRLLPRMLIPVVQWSRENPQRRLGLGGGLALHGSDPLRKITYRTEATIQKQKVWGEALIQSAIGRVIGTLRIYSEPDAVVARILNIGGRIEEITYGEQSQGIGLSVALPLRFQANVRHSYARISSGVRMERSRWFSLDHNSVPSFRDSGQSLAEWRSRVRFDTATIVGLRLQQNLRDIVPNRGTVFGVYGRTFLPSDQGPRRSGLFARLDQYWPISTRTNTGFKLGVSFLAQSSAGVYSNSLVLPHGKEGYIGDGTHLRIDAEIFQPIWYIQDGFLTIPTYFKVLYLYGFAQRLVHSDDQYGIWSGGIGVGLQFRLFHYLNMDVRTSINPFDIHNSYLSLM